MRYMLLPRFPLDDKDIVEIKKKTGWLLLTCKQYCSMRQGPMATRSPSRAPMTAWMT